MDSEERFIEGLRRLGIRIVVNEEVSRESYLLGKEEVDPSYFSKRDYQSLPEWVVVHIISYSDNQTGDDYLMMDVSEEKKNGCLFTIWLKNNDLLNGKLATKRE